MRRLSIVGIVLILVALIELVLAIPAAAAPPRQDNSTIRQQIYDWLATNKSVIDQAQSGYASDHEAYGQLLPTDTQTIAYTTTNTGQLGSNVIDGGNSAPASTNEPTLPDNASETPTDTQTSWLSLAPSIVQQHPPATVAVDVYDGPEGHGYVIRLGYCLDSTCYEKAIQHGPETYRDHDWQQLPDDQP